MFTVTQVGSWPRSRQLLRALRDRQRGRMAPNEFQRIADEEVRRCVEAQLEAGVELVVDGEQRRDSFYAFITDRVQGTELTSLAQLLDTVEDKAGFEEMLTTLDVPASAINNPTCVGKLSRRMPLTLDELRFVQTLTDRPVKVPLPGPYLLTRSMWVGALSGKAYGDKTEMADDVVRLLRQELLELRDAGAAVVQFDEPVLTEVVMSEECDRRTFMWATLATRRDAGAELAYAAQLINRVVEGVEGVRTAVHVCRGNWSRQEDVLLSGDYTRLVPAFQQMKVDQLVLEYATPRAGELSVVGRTLGGREIGLGVVNPRTAEVERPQSIVARAEQALQFFTPQQISLNPDCGFGCFARRCVNDAETAGAKLRAMAEAAAILRQRHG